jgi:hypothetical protein
MSLNEIKIPKNMNYQKEEFESKNLDHLGIIAGIIDEIGIVEKINELFLVDSREKVNTGEVVKAIILNGLGFVSRPLYLFPDFFQDKPIEHLIREGIKASDLNDDGDKEIITSDGHTLTIHSLYISKFVLQNISTSDYYNLSEVDFGGFTPTTTTTLYNPQSSNYSTSVVNRFFNALLDNGGSIAALILIIGMIILAAKFGGSVILMVLAGFIGLILSFILGFIGKGTLVLFIIVIVILAVLGIAIQSKK